MKKIYLLLICLSTILNNQANAQCTPDPNNLTLITPDTTTNFVSGIVGQPYSQVVLLHPPSDTTVTLPPSPTPILVSDVVVELMSFSGLPPGLTNQCNPANCIFNGGISGCSEISGIPTTAGTYPLFAIIGASGTIFGGTISVGPIVDTLLAYRIIIAPSGVGINDQQNSLSFINVSPTIAKENIELQFTSALANDTKIQILNTLGESITSINYKSKAGINALNISTQTLAEGIYILSLQNSKQTIVKRFIVVK
jgi:Secretion system C-terminal sorting domain